VKKIVAARGAVETMKTTALAVRPYGGALQRKVFALLASAGVEVEAPAELGDGTSNEGAVLYLRDRRPDLLLVPFHVVRSGGGDRTSGLDLLARLREEAPRFRGVPAIMPVSVFARLAFEGAWKTRPLDHVLPLLEHAIDEKPTRRALDGFLAATGLRRGSDATVDARP
jgi:hypothetical protein